MLKDEAMLEDEDGVRTDVGGGIGGILAYCGIFPILASLHFGSSARLASPLLNSHHFE